MGWQSYVLFGKISDIVDAIQEHNELEVGEELEGFTLLTITKPYKSYRDPHRHFMTKGAQHVVCGNAGGGWSTFEFFGKKGIGCLGFDSSFQPIMKKQDVKYFDALDELLFEANNDNSV